MNGRSEREKATQPEKVNLHYSPFFGTKIYFYFDMYQNKILESAFIDVINKKGYNIVVECVYLSLPLHGF